MNLDGNKVLASEANAVLTGASIPQLDLREESHASKKMGHAAGFVKPLSSR